MAVISNKALDLITSMSFNFVSKADCQLDDEDNVDDDDGAILHVFSFYVVSFLSKCCTVEKICTSDSKCTLTVFTQPIGIKQKKNL